MSALQSPDIALAWWFSPVSNLDRSPPDYRASVQSSKQGRLYGTRYRGRDTEHQRHQSKRGDNTFHETPPDYRLATI